MICGHIKWSIKVTVKNIRKLSTNLNLCKCQTRAFYLLHILTFIHHRLWSCIPVSSAAKVKGVNLVESRFADLRGYQAVYLSYTLIYHMNHTFSCLWYFQEYHLWIEFRSDPRRLNLSIRVHRQGQYQYYPLQCSHQNSNSVKLCLGGPRNGRQISICILFLCDWSLDRSDREKHSWSRASYLLLSTEL